LTIQDRILVYLTEHPEGVDDDTIAAALGLRSRQQVNQRCRRLEEFDVVIRRVLNGKIRNFLNPDPRQVPPRVSAAADVAERPWCWEGNVQAAVVRYLSSVGYQIEFEANTALRQQGKDIIALAPSGDTLWVSAKGYPAGTVRTNPRTQARHWFSHALFDLILWHGEEQSKALALAFPEQTTYRNLAKRAAWFLASLGACIYWVDEDGNVAADNFDRAV
jgi:hypothetical protein